MEQNNMNIDYMEQDNLTEQTKILNRIDLIKKHYPNFTAIPMKNGKDGKPKIAHHPSMKSGMSYHKTTNVDFKSLTSKAFRTIYDKNGYILAHPTGAGLITGINVNQKIELIESIKLEDYEITDKEMRNKINESTECNGKPLEGITVIDFDVKNHTDSLKYIDMFDMKKTLYETTPSGGYHFYYKYDNRLKNTENQDLQIDIRNNGGYIVCGATNGYIWQNLGVELQQIPEGLIEIFKESGMCFEKDETLLEKSTAVKSQKCEKSLYVYSMTEKQLNRIETGLNTYCMAECNDKTTKKNMWKYITYAIADLYNNLDFISSQYSDRIIKMWDDWSKKSDLYNEKRNFELFNPNETYDIEFLYKKINMNITQTYKDNAEMKKKEHCKYATNKITKSLKYSPVQNINSRVKIITDDKTKTVSDNTEFTRLAESEYETKQYTLNETIELKIQTDKDGNIKKSKKSKINDNKIIKREYIGKKEYDNVFIRAKMGSGKSYYCTNHCKEFMKKHPDGRIISVITLKALINQHMKAFSDVGINMKSYDDIDMNHCVSDYKHLIITIDSFHKLDMNEWKNIDKTLIFFDEARSNLYHSFQSSTISERILIQKNLNWFLGNCSKLLACDADMDDITINHIDSINTQRKSIFYNHLRRPYVNAKAFRHVNLKTLKDKLFDDIKAGGCPLIACDMADAENGAEFIKNEIMKKCNVPESKFKVYTKNEGDIKDLHNVSNEWSNYIVIYSPKIQYGIDYNPINKQNVYVISLGHHMIPTSLSQMTFRNRNINEIHYHFITKPNNQKYETINMIHEDYNNDVSIFNKYTQLNSIDINSPINEIEERVKLSIGFNKTFFEFEFIDNVLMSNPTHYYEQICLIENGFNITLIDSNKEKQTEQEQADNKEIIEKIKDDRLEMIQNVIDKTDYDKETHKYIEDRLKYYEFLPKDEIIEKYSNFILKEHSHESFYKYDINTKTSDELIEKMKSKKTNEFDVKLCKTSYMQILLLKEFEKETGYDFHNIKACDKKEISVDLKKRIETQFRLKLTDSVLAYSRMCNNLFGTIIEIYNSKRNGSDDRTRTKEYSIHPNMILYDEMIELRKQYYSSNKLNEIIDTCIHTEK